MAETAQSVGQILDDPDFRALPQERRDAIMRDLLAQATPPSAAATQPWWQGAMQAMTGGGLEGASGLPPGLPPEALKAGAKETVAGAIDMAGTSAGTIIGAATSPITGPVGPYLGGVGGSYGAQKLNEYLGLRDPNARLTLGPVDVSQETLSWALPAVLGAPALFQETVLKPIAKSSVIGQKALQNVEKQAHDVTSSARQVEVDTARAQNKAIAAANEQRQQIHASRVANVEQKNQTARQAYQDYVTRREADLEQVNLVNEQLKARHAQAKLLAEQQNKTFKQLNDDAEAIFKNLTAGERANYVQLKTAADRINKAYTHRESRIETFARGQKAAAPQQVQAAFDSLPAIPNKADVQKLYQDIDASLATIDMTVPVQKYREVQAQIKTWNEGLEKFPRGEREVKRLQQFLKGLEVTPEGIVTGEPLSLTAIHNGTKFMGRQVRQLRRAARRGVPGAEQELAAANKLYIALDESFEAAAQHHTIPAQIRDQAMEARAAWKRVQTWEDMKEFGQDMTRLDASTGNPVLTPIQARQRLESPQYASLKRFLQQTPVDPANPGAGNMYDFTVETFKALEPKQMTLKDRVAFLSQLQAVGDPKGRLVDTSPIDTSQFRPPERAFAPPVPQSQFVPEPWAPALAPPPRMPPKNLNDDLLARVPEAPGKLTGVPVPDPLPPFQGQEIRQGLPALAGQYTFPALGGVAGTFSRLFGISPIYGVGAGMALGAGANRVLANFLMSAPGQKVLLGILQSRGLRLDPVTMGMLNAGVRQGLTLSLPADDDIDDDDD